jgi:hypothetical protein
MSKPTPNLIPPHVDLEITRGADYTWFFTFENMAAPVPRPLYAFPNGTVFKFRANDQYVDIAKASNGPSPRMSYNTETRTLRLDFVPDDTDTVTTRHSAPYEMDAFIPLGTTPETYRRYPLMDGDLKISYRKLLNASP